MLFKSLITHQLRFQLFIYFRVWDIPWSMANLAAATFHYRKLVISPQKLSTVHNSSGRARGFWTPSYSRLECGLPWSWQVLDWNHSSCGFMGAVVLSSPEYPIFHRSFPISGSCNLSPPSSTVVSESWQGIWCKYCVYGWVLHANLFFALWPVVTFCINHPPLCKNASLVRSEERTNLWLMRGI